MLQIYSKFQKNLVVWKRDSLQRSHKWHRSFRRTQQCGNSFHNLGIISSGVRFRRTQQCGNQDTKPEFVSVGADRFQKNLVVWKLQRILSHDILYHWVSEELSSVETVKNYKNDLANHNVSEELSSVETVLLKLSVQNVIRSFRRTQQCGNLHIRGEKLPKELVSEELSSVETQMKKKKKCYSELSFRRTQQCGNEAERIKSLLKSRQFQKNLVVWKQQRFYTPNLVVL